MNSESRRCKDRTGLVWKNNIHLLHQENTLCLLTLSSWLVACGCRWFGRPWCLLLPVPSRCVYEERIKFDRSTWVSWQIRYVGECKAMWFSYGIVCPDRLVFLNGMRRFTLFLLILFRIPGTVWRLELFLWKLYSWTGRWENVFSDKRDSERMKTEVFGSLENA